MRLGGLARQRATADPHPSPAASTAPGLHPARPSRPTVPGRREGPRKRHKACLTIDTVVRGSKSAVRGVPFPVAPRATRRSPT